MWLTWCRKRKLLSLLEPWQMTFAFTKSQHWKLQPWGSLRPQEPGLRRQVVSVWHSTSLPWGLLLARIRYDYKPHLSHSWCLHKAIECHIFLFYLPAKTWCCFDFAFEGSSSWTKELSWGREALRSCSWCASQPHETIREVEGKEVRESQRKEKQQGIPSLICETKIHVLLDLKKYYYVRLYHVLVQVFLLIKTKIGSGDRYCFKTLQFPPLDYLHLTVLLLIIY